MPDDTPSHPSAHTPRQAPNKPPSPAEQGPFSATFPAHADLPYADVTYGPDIATEADLRLLGDLADRRVLDLGAGAGHAAIAMARGGAHVIAVDPSAENLARVRRAADEHELRVELHQSDLADLPFLRADSVDLVYSAYGLATVPDLGRTFRQLHRVLRPERPLVFSLPHPAFALVDPTSGEPMRIRRSYWDPTPREWNIEGRTGADHTHTVEELFTALHRAGLRVETLLEPEPLESGRHSPYYSEVMRWIPATLVVRARKLGR